MPFELVCILFVTLKTEMTLFSWRSVLKEHRLLVKKKKKYL